MVEHPRPAASAGGTFPSFAWWAVPILALLAAYAAVPTVGFVWDDYDLIVGSPLVTGHAAVADHFRQPFWSDTLQSARSFYRPLVTLSYAWDHWLWNNWAGGYHLTNLLLHLACTLMVMALCRRAGGGLQAAGLLATAFAVFPRLTESVAWISGRTDCAAAAGALAALLLYKPGEGNWGRKALAGLFLLAGLLCKEVALSAAVALALFAWHEAPRPRRVLAIVVQLSPILAALAVYAAMRFFAMAASATAHGAAQRTPLAVFLSSSEAIFRYAWMLVDPLRPRLQLGDLDQPRPVLSALGVALAITGLFLVRRGYGRWTGWAWVALGFGGTAIAMVLHLVPFEANIVAADRFLYIPVAALAMAGARLLDRAWQRRRDLVLLGSVAILGSFTIATALRVQTWTHEVSLWRQEVASSFPGAAVPRSELGVALMHRGRYDEALVFLEQLSSDKPSLVAINQASCLDKVGRRPEAMALLERLLLSEPKRSRARINLMLMHARDRRFDVARAEGERLALALPGRPDIKDLVAQIDAAAADWSSMPAETADEPITLRARRAAWFERLGAVPEAKARWTVVARDPQASADLRLQAATFVALHGGEAEARGLLGALAAQGVLADKLPNLRAALEARFEEE